MPIFVAFLSLNLMQVTFSIHAISLTFPTQTPASSRRQSAVGATHMPEFGSDYSAVHLAKMIDVGTH